MLFQQNRFLKSLYIKVYLMTSEERERRNQYQRNYYKTDKSIQYRKQKMADYNKLQTFGYYTIYCLKNYDGNGHDYVGVTKQPYRRLKDHSTKGKDISNMQILGFRDEKEEAYELERKYHALGYDGGTPFVQRGIDASKKMLGFRLTKEEKATIDRLARENGMSRSTYIRSKILT